MNTNYLVGKDMKDAFQQQHEADQSGDYTIGPGGKKVLTPEAMQRKVARDRAVSEEVSPDTLPDYPRTDLLYVTCQPPILTSASRSSTNLWCVVMLQC